MIDRRSSRVRPNAAMRAAQPETAHLVGVVEDIGEGVAQVVWDTKTVSWVKISDLEEVAA